MHARTHSHIITLSHAHTHTHTYIYAMLLCNEPKEEGLFLDSERIVAQCEDNKLIIIVIIS